MSEQTIAIHMPAPLYQRLQRLAKVTRRPLENVVVQTLDANVPALPENLPQSVQEELAALEMLEDEELWEIAEGTYDKQQEYGRLLEKNDRETLTDVERVQLKKHYDAVNRLTLRKAYAYVLLKWRGYQLPSISELEARA
jgi:hypothetical protein